MVAAVCPVWNFQLGTESAGTDWPGPTPNWTNFSSHMAGQTLAALGSSASFWGLLVREGQATREIRSWPLESALMPSRGLKCRPAGPMHMARQPGLRKSSTFSLTMYVT